jgi:hypothetical protein
MTVFIVLEGPDMTYYGDAAIKGVFATREEAEARAREVQPNWTEESAKWGNLGVEEWAIGASDE